MLGSCGELSKVGTEIESIRTDLGLTLKELCTVYLLLYVQYECSLYVCMHMGTYTYNTFPHFTVIFFEAVAIMSLFQRCLKFI